MTVTAKEYLNRIRTQEFLLRQVELELMEVRADILSLRGSSLTEKVSGTKDADTANKYIRLEKYAERVNREWDVLIGMRVQAKELIMGMPDQRERAALYARYIRCRRWEDIADEMHYSWNGIFKLHGQALRTFGKLYADIINDGGKS